MGDIVSIIASELKVNKLRRGIMVLLWIILFLLSVLIDQGTKEFVITNIRYGDSSAVLSNYFYIRPVKNKGINISFLHDKWYIFAAFILLTIIFFLYIVIKSYNNNIKISIVFITAGVTSNFIDFLMRGSVIDFLYFELYGISFPNFNIADLFIVAGITTLIYYATKKYSTE